MNGTSDLADRPKDQRKYQVFISSTFRDLAEQRRMVLDVIVDHGHMPIALERFPAADKTIPSVIQKTIEASQIYVVILGYRYGALVEGRDISFSHLEYEIAYKEPVPKDEEGVGIDRTECSPVGKIDRFDVRSKNRALMMGAGVYCLALDLAVGGEVLSRTK